MSANFKQEMLKLPGLVKCPRCGKMCIKLVTAQHFQVYVHSEDAYGLTACNVALSGDASEDFMEETDAPQH